MCKKPKFLMTKKELSEYVKYCNSGASEDSKALFLQQFKHRPEIAYEDVRKSAERTCKNSETNLSDTFFKCSACGAYSYSFLRHKDGTMDSTRYCPNCGSKVVS